MVYLPPSPVVYPLPQWSTHFPSGLPLPQWSTPFPNGLPPPQWSTPFPSGLPPSPVVYPLPQWSTPFPSGLPPSQPSPTSHGIKWVWSVPLLCFEVASLRVVEVLLPNQKGLGRRYMVYRINKVPSGYKISCSQHELLMGYEKKTPTMVRKKETFVE